MHADTDITAGRKEQPEAPLGPCLEWRVHPARRRPWVTALVTVFILLVSFLVLLATASKWFTFFALIVLFGSLAKFYFPTGYRLDQSGLTIKTSTQTIRKEWKLFRSYYPDRNGVLLSPFPNPSRLENFRGVYLMFDANRDEVVAFVKTRIESVRDGGAGATA